MNSIKLMKNKCLLDSVNMLDGFTKVVPPQCNCQRDQEKIVRQGEPDDREGGRDNLNSFRRILSSLNVDSMHVWSRIDSHDLIFDCLDPTLYLSKVNDFLPSEGPGRRKDCI